MCVKLKCYHLHEVVLLTGPRTLVNSQCGWLSLLAEPLGGERGGSFAIVSAVGSVHDAIDPVVLEHDLGPGERVEDLMIEFHASQTFVS